MLLVKAAVKPSAIAGMGLFAGEFIPRGTIVWKYHAGYDFMVAPEEAEKLPPIIKERFFNYSYLDKIVNRYVYCVDDARFFNHSDTPNTESVGESDPSLWTTIASRDIAEGEELTCDYREFDASPHHQNLHQKI